MAKKKAAKKKTATKKKAAKKKPTRVIDEPAKTVFYKQGDLIDGFEILEEAAARTKKKALAASSTIDIANSLLDLRII